MENGFVIVRYILLIILLSIALYDDIKRGKISNKITISALILGIILSLFHSSFSDIGKIIKELLFMFVIVFILYVLRFIGAGDAKLLLAIAALLDAPFAIGVTVYAILIGAIITIFMKKDESIVDSVKRFINNIKSFFLVKKIIKDENKKAVKFAIPVAIACCIEYVLPLFKILSTT